MKALYLKPNIYKIVVNDNMLNIRMTEITSIPWQTLMAEIESRKFILPSAEEIDKRLRQNHSDPNSARLNALSPLLCQHANKEFTAHTFTNILIDTYNHLVITQGLSNLDLAVLSVTLDIISDEILNDDKIKSLIKFKLNWILEQPTIK